MEPEALIAMANGDPQTMIMGLIGWLWLRAQASKYKSEDEKDEHVEKTEKVVNHGALILRALDIVVKAIDMANAKDVKEAVTELSMTDQDARDIIIKAVDRRKTENDVNRRAMAEIAET